MAKETKKENNKDKKYFKEFKAELKRVSWPTFKQLVNNTSIVIAIVLLVAAIVFVLDVIFKTVNDFGVEKLKAVVTSSSSETEEPSEESEVSNEAGTEVEENSDETEQTQEKEEATTEETPEQTGETSVEQNN